MQSPGTTRWSVIPLIGCLLVSTPQGVDALQRTPAVTPPVPVVAPDYVIGPDDVLSIRFWREDDLSGDVTVRADGRITVPLLNDVTAAGLTPAQLKATLEQRAAAFITEPNATVIVKAMTSRRVFINGMVANPGAFPLQGSMSVVQLIALAGGFREFANTDEIVVIRRGRTGAPSQHLTLNYGRVTRRKKPAPDIELEPGDTVVVR